MIYFFTVVYQSLALQNCLIKMKSILSPVRDRILVEEKIVPNPNRAVRFGIWNLPDRIGNHIAYLTARVTQYGHRFLPICSPFGTAQGFNQHIQNDLGC